jgi:DNA gyrase subunit A
MMIDRPDLSQVAPEVRAYIDILEAELARLRDKSSQPKQTESPLEAGEPPTSLNVVTLSAGGLVKRTPRHLYPRQHRAGMGIFDLEVGEDDRPAHLAIVDDSQDLLIVSNQARAFRLPLRNLPESSVRSRGQRLHGHLSFEDNEKIAVVMPHQSHGYLALVTERGYVRRLRYHFFGENMTPGATLYDLREFGSPAVACWSDGNGDLFVATRQGRAIRFDEQKIPARGSLGIRLDEGDKVAAVTAVKPDSGVFLLGADGKGIIRLMSGFNPNKSPGSGGKTALKTDHLVGAMVIDQADHIFIISRLSKIIRFPATEVSTTEGVVQGVSCMALRSDETVVLTNSKIKND